MEAFTPIGPESTLHTELDAGRKQMFGMAIDSFYEIILKRGYERAYVLVHTSSGKRQEPPAGTCYPPSYIRSHIKALVKYAIRAGKP